jgi:hypothetical protein
MLPPNLDVSIGAEDEHSIGPSVPRQVLQEIEAGAVCPVKIIQEERDRHLGGNCLQEARE